MEGRTEKTRLRCAELLKFQIRSTKYETNPKLKAGMLKTTSGIPSRLFRSFGFSILNLFGISDFEFRIWLRPNAVSVVRGGKDAEDACNRRPLDRPWVS